MIITKIPETMRNDTSKVGDFSKIMSEGGRDSADFAMISHLMQLLAHRREAICAARHSCPRSEEDFVTYIDAINRNIRRLLNV